MPPSSSYSYSPSFVFPGETYLSHVPPHHRTERQRLVGCMVGTVLFFVVVVPYLVVWRYGNRTNDRSTTTEDDDTNVVKKTTSSDKKSRKHATTTARSNKRRGNKRSRTPAATDTTTTTTKSACDGNEESSSSSTTELPSLLLPLLNLLCPLVLLGIVMRSSNNTYSARAIFEAPMFTTEECKYVIDMAHGAAGRNVERASLELTEARSGEDSADDDVEEKESNSDDKKQKNKKLLLSEPQGWNKDRHDAYPTTDLNVVSDPFTSEDLQWLKHKLDARLAPAIERVYGIARGAVRANDLFVVRYDSSLGQPFLERHTDSSHVSFIVLLNDDFTGGGTRFHSRIDGTYLDVHPTVGHVIFFNAAMNHEGLPVIEGTRYIFVGFCSVDVKDPFTGVSTGLSMFASWLSMPWAQVRFKEGFFASTKRVVRSRGLSAEPRDGDNEGNTQWTDSWFMRSLFRDVNYSGLWISDVWASFFHAKLVKEEDEEAYLAALDEAETNRRTWEDEHNVTADRSNGHASWFQGQQIDVNIDGSLASKWKGRLEAGEEKFTDDL